VKETLSSEIPEISFSGNRGPRFFLAGIIQGSLSGRDIHDQEYRKTIRRILEKAFPVCRIICPMENHPRSVTYDNSKARRVFLGHLEDVRQSGVLVVYLPEASMGSAIEMWEAHRQGVVTVTISPMIHNWIVRLLSDYVFPDIEAFRIFVESGGLHRVLETRAGHQPADQRKARQS
jgi:hypothetical protein